MFVNKNILNHSAKSGLLHLCIDYKLILQKI